MALPVAEPVVPFFNAALSLSVLLTAAHCEGIFLDGAYIGANTIDGEGSELFRVDTEFPHPDYNTQGDDNGTLKDDRLNG